MYHIMQHNSSDDVIIEDVNLVKNIDENKNVDTYFVNDISIVESHVAGDFEIFS